MKKIYINKRYNGHLLSRQIPIYEMNLIQTPGGTIYANPMSGYSQTEVTLSNVPDTDYIFQSYDVSGSTLYDTNKFKFTDSDVTAIANWTYEPNYNPLNLPSNTIRTKWKSGSSPTAFRIGDSANLVDSTNNIWDVYKQSNDWSYFLEGYLDLLEVLGANTTNVSSMIHLFRSCTSLSSIKLFDTRSITGMGYMFYGCNSLSSVPLFNTSGITKMDAMFSGCTSLSYIPLFDTRSVTSMGNMFNSCYSLSSVPLFDTRNVISFGNMFYNCSSLTSIPLFDTRNVLRVGNMCYNCVNVQSGALALYQQASTQTKPPSGHYRAFFNCGINTQTGSAELSQIPSDWK